MSRSKAWRCVIRPSVVVRMTVPFTVGISFASSNTKCSLLTFLNSGVELIFIMSLFTFTYCLLFLLDSISIAFSSCSNFINFFIVGFSALIITIVWYPTALSSSFNKFTMAFCMAIFTLCFVDVFHGLGTSFSKGFSRNSFLVPTEHFVHYLSDVKG